LGQIGKWWIVNLDIATDPKFDGEPRPLARAVRKGIVFGLP
jgi:hypothetical protein